MKTIKSTQLLLILFVLIVAVFMLSPSSAKAQYPRKVLVENFDNFSRIFEDSTIFWLDSLSEKFSGQVISLRYHTASCLAGCDPEDELSFHKTVNIDNRSFYYPYHANGEIVFIDGTYGEMAWQIGDGSDSIFMAQQIAAGSPLNISVQHAFNTAHDSIHIHVEVTSAVNFVGGTNSMLRVVPFEERIDFEEALGTYNYSVTSVPRVVRDLVPDHIGIYVGNINAGATVSYDFDWPLINVYDMNELRVAAFVQDDNTKEVIQAGQSLPQPVAIADCSARLTKKYYCSQNASNVYPEIEIKNEGAFTIHNLNIDYGVYQGGMYNTTWSGTFAPNTSMIFPLAVQGLSTGSYILELNVQSDLPYDTKPHNNIIHYEPLEHTNTEQDITFYVVPPTTYPVAEGFESGIFPPTGWNLETTGTTGSYAFWQTTNPGGDMTSANSIVAQLGVMHKYQIHNERNILTTPSIDFTSASSPILSFDRAYRCKTYAHAPSTYDSLNVWASADCGTTWQLVYQKDASALTTYTWCTQTNFWTPTVYSDWQSDSVPLSIFDGQSSVILKFEAVSGLGQSLYLDNINIAEGTLMGMDGIAATEGMEVSPNPATDYFNVMLGADKVYESAIFSLSDVMGRSVLSTPLNGNRELHVSCSDLSPGIYFATLTNSLSQMTIRKIIIQ